MLKNQIAGKKVLALASGTLEPHRAQKIQPNESQLLRRIDWRFLLPDPALRRVAYIGKKGGRLLWALQTFSESLTTFPVPPRSETLSEESAVFDLVVLRSTNRQHVLPASRMLTSEGYFYWELDRRDYLPDSGNDRHGWRAIAPRRVLRLLRSNLSHTKKYVDVLELSGFCDIEVQWHRPNFEECLELIPLHRETTLEYVFSRNTKSLKGRMEFFLGRGLMQIGLLARLIPCFSLVARKSSPMRDAA